VALLNDSCQRLQDVWRRLRRRPTDFDPRAGHFDADGVAAQLIAVFGKPPGEVAHSVCDGVSKTSQTVDPGYIRVRALIAFGNEKRRD
jgi:hypothetical protein